MFVRMNDCIGRSTNGELDDVVMTDAVGTQRIAGRTVVANGTLDFRVSRVFRSSG